MNSTLFSVFNAYIVASICHVVVSVAVPVTPVRGVRNEPESTDVPVLPSDVTVRQYESEP